MGKWGCCTNGYQLVEPVDNLKAFATSRPPLVIFMACLGLFGLVLMTLAFYIKDAELKKPDGEKDWNVFLESFSDLEFCIQNRTLMTSDVSTAATTTQVIETTEAGNLGRAGTVPTLSDIPRNYSVSMMLAIHPTIDFVSIPHNITSLNGFVYGSEVGLDGAAANERISFAMQLPFEWNSTHCNGISQSCNVVHIYTCVYFYASDFVFPISRHPHSCETVNDTGVEYHASVLGHKPNKNIRPAPENEDCRARTVIKINYRLDPTLTVLLSLSDRSLINLHLLHTSYFLFVMTITLLLYAAIRGRPLKIKSTFSTDPEFNAPPGIGGTKKYRPPVGDFFLTLSRGFTADQPQYQPQDQPLGYPIDQLQYMHLQDQPRSINRSINRRISE